MLIIHNLKKSFTNSANEKSEVINIQEFHLIEAEQLAVTGESGVGKSTFLNLISGIVSSDSGEIIFDGIDITKLSESKRDLFRAKNIGYIFQSFNLLQGFSSLENLMLGMMFAGKTDKRKCEDALVKVGLTNKLKSKPAELSVGEQQRVAVARAIVNSPKLILSDEPTANLDKKNSDSVIQLIKNLCTENKIALIIVSHDKDVIANFLNKKDFNAINY